MYILTTYESGEFLFKSLILGAMGEDIPVKYLQDRLFFFVSNPRPGKRD
jgi:hypothetical protein